MCTTLLGNHTCSSFLEYKYKKAMFSLQATHPVISASSILGHFFVSPRWHYCLSSDTTKVSFGSWQKPPNPSLFLHLFSSPPSLHSSSSVTPRISFLKSNKLHTNPPCLPITFWVKFKVLFAMQGLVWPPTSLFVFTSQPHLLALFSSMPLLPGSLLPL